MKMWLVFRQVLFMVREDRECVGRPPIHHNPWLDGHKLTHRSRVVRMVAAILRVSPLG